jgi:CRISPR-associated protein Cas1
MRDLHELPKLRDGLSYLYVELCRVEQKHKAVEFIDQEGRTMVPAAALAVLMLGPGTTVTHAAIKALADNGCSVVWTGQEGTRCYAQGTGETRRAYHLLHQAALVSDPQKRMQVVMRMYRHRFGEELDPSLDLLQIRGMEGVRVRKAYQAASEAYGVPWRGRRYDRNDWGASDPVNRALSAANALLNGLCHAAIVSGGYSPALGFIHTGKQLSFVYDVADLYKVEVTIPLAFGVVAESSRDLGKRVRAACREAFKEHRLLKRLLPDIETVLDVPEHLLTAGGEADSDPARPEPLWSPPAAQIQTGATSAATGGESTAGPRDADAMARDVRRQRAQEGLQGDWTVRRHAPRVWHVTTRADHPGYVVRQVGKTWQCECPDFARNGLGMCKHTAAVELIQAREDGE